MTDSLCFRQSDPLSAPTPVPQHVPLTSFLMLVASNFSIATAFYLTLTSGPTHLGRLGGGIAAGAATTVSTFATAAASLVAPPMIARFGRRGVFAVAALALGMPCFALFGNSLQRAELACAVRGLGLGLAFVATGGLAAALVPASRRGELLGLLGLAFSVPAIFAVAAGQWLLIHSADAMLATAATGFALAPLLALGLFPGRGRGGEPRSAMRLPWARLAWPIAVHSQARRRSG